METIIRQTADTRTRIAAFVLVLQLYPWLFLTPSFAQKLNSLNWIECQTSTSMGMIMMEAKCTRVQVIQPALLVAGNMANGFGPQWLRL